MTHLGSLGLTIGQSEHFEIIFWVNLTLDTPRFSFNIYLHARNGKPSHKCVEDDPKLVRLLVSEMRSSWLGFDKTKPIQLDDANFILFERDNLNLIISIHEEEITFIVNARDEEVDSDIWTSYEGCKASILFNRLYTVMDNHKKTNQTS